MHFDILVEDISGMRAIDILVPNIVDLSQGHSFTVHPYKGVGQIPKGMNSAVDASKRQLLNNLPKLLKGYGRTHTGYGSGYQAVIVVVVDLDDKCMHEFRNELLSIWDACDPKPNVKFCFAVEEGEAWFLGDISAIKSAYPRAKDSVLNSYSSDSICGTWEVLADAIHLGGSTKLKKEGWVETGRAKSEWAVNISPHMDVNNNISPSFCYFRDSLKALVV